MDVSGLVKLDLAAKRLGCHVETLRIRVRDGRLRAVRGAHGAYYVSQPALDALPHRGRPPPAPAPSEVTPVDRKRGWELVEQGVAKRGRAARDQMLGLVRTLKENPDRDRRLYRLLAVHGLVLAGFRSEQIAAELGISARHVRRLALRSPFLAIQRTLFSKTARTEGRAQERAQDIVAELRASLVASGFRPHLLAVGDSDRPAFVQRSLDSAQRRHLRAAGLAEAEIDAIAAIGMGTDELHELVLRGIDHGREGTDGRQ